MKLLIIKTLVLLALGLSMSCGSSGVGFSPEASETADVAKIAQKMATGQRLSNPEFERISTIYEKYPSNEEIGKQYENALTQRKDWKTLAAFYEKQGLGNEEIRKKAAASYFRAGQYAKAKDLSKDFDTKDTNLRRIRVGSLYNLGDYEVAAKVLDENWETIKSEKSVDEFVYRGMIHFYNKDNEKALEVFKAALEIDSKNIPAYNGLSRVYTAMGNDEKAAESLEKLRTNYEELTKVEKAKTRFVEKIYKLQEDYKQKRYAEVIVTAKQIEAEVPAAQKKVFYQYLYNSYKALGRNTEAQEVLKKARQ